MSRTPWPRRTIAVLVSAIALVAWIGSGPIATPAAATARGSRPISAMQVAPTPSGAFVGSAPFRVVDTREGGGCVAAASPRRVQVAGVAGSGVPSGVGAVALNITVVAPSAPGYLTVYPAGAERPLASSVNYTAGQTIPNNVLIEVGTADSVDVFANAGCPQIVVDVVGYFAAGTAVPGGFTGNTPFRVLDTRTSDSCLAPNVERSIRVAGMLDTGAVALNVTVVAPSGPGYLTVYPAFSSPATSTINYAAGQVIANGVIATLGTLGTITFRASSGCPHLVVDYLGHFLGDGTVAGTFDGLSTPTRVADTRVAGGCVTAGAPRRIQVAGVAGSGVPTGAPAVALNVTVTASSGPGFVTVYPAGATRPLASSLNFLTGQTIANGVITLAGASDAIDVYANAGCPHVVVDVIGSFTAGT